MLAFRSIGGYAADKTLSNSGSASVHSGWSAAGQLRDLGENHSFWTGSLSGTTVNHAGKGLLHKMAWSCPGVTITYRGSYVHHGYCALIDSDGDRIYSKSEGKGPPERVDLVEAVTYEGGTGKYQGIQGS